MKTLINQFSHHSDGPGLTISQCETRSEWVNEWYARKQWESFDRVFETIDGKQAILYGHHEEYWNYWEVVLEP